jgi:transposase
VSCVATLEPHPKKKSLIALERDPSLRAQFALDLCAVEDEDLVFIDESGFHTSMTRTRARSPKGERAVGKVPRNRGENPTLLCGLTEQGPLAEWVVSGGVNGEVFETYVQKVLLPELRVGQVVVMDNLGAHRTAKVRALLEKAGVQLVLLPGYSPDYNPIEMMFSKLKAAMRKLGRRTREGVTGALRIALDAVTQGDARGWFQHARSLQHVCRYRC